jgi:TolB protein
MKFLSPLLILFTLLYTNLAAPLHIELGKNDFGLTTRTSSVKLLLCLTPGDTELTTYARIVQSNLQRSGQFVVTLTPCSAPTKKTEVKKLFDTGYSLVIFLNHADNKKALEWRLYDASEAQMVKGKKLPKNNLSSATHAHLLSDELWHALTGQPSSFSSKIAYTKRPANSRKSQSTIYLSNPDGSESEPFVKTPGTYVSLYWHTNPSAPTLFYSEFTRFNVRLVSFFLQGHKQTVLDVNGTCVGISLSADANKAVYCRSGDIWLYTYDPLIKKGRHRKLIKNDGKNLSPLLLANGDIIFCSDAPSLAKSQPRPKGPQIYLYDSATNTIRPLTKDGFCVGPSYCLRTQKLAYSKRVNGTMQLFLYDFKTNQHKQITSDKGNKIDCCWSPCGAYLAFCYQDGRSSRIAVLHVALSKRSYITPDAAHCASPAWSPVFIA